MPSVLLIIPCYRERERLPRFLPALCSVLREFPGIAVRVVDDGSGPEQQAWLANYVEDLRREFPMLQAAQMNPLNAGKGGAVYSGWDAHGGEQILGFVDADGAVPPEEITRVLRAAVQLPEAAVYAVRTGEDGTQVRRTLHRRLAGSIFRRLVRGLFGFPVPDTQCGFKLVPATAYRLVRQDLKEERFIFDVDLTWHLLRRGTRIVPVPIHWTESPGSRLRPSSAFSMYRALRALRKRLGDWRSSTD